MQKRFAILHRLTQLWNEQVSFYKRYSYAPAATGFTTADFRVSKNNIDKTRPWFER